MSAAVLTVFTACKEEAGNGGDTDFDNIVENGFYVAGEACGYADLTVKCQFGQGINEVDGSTREGMYEKYIVLEAGKEFSFINKAGNEQVYYGANLVATDLETDNAPIAGYKGSLEENVKMTVDETALYHIILDFNQDGALTNVGGAQVVLAKVNMGVSGGMNSWGWTAAETMTEIKAGVETVTWTWTEQQMAAAADFKFKDNQAWKINLDDAELVKANSNLGLNSLPGGENIPVEKAGNYTITLTYTLTGGDVSKSFVYETILTSESDLPTTMYMIGADFGNWDWESNGVVEMVPVHSHMGMFWTVRYITTNGFKFCAERAWNGDFFTLGTDEGFTTNDGNCFVETAGMYTVLVDLNAGSISIYPAEVYGMGDVWGNWDEGSNPFTAEDGTMTATAPNAGNLRMYAKVKGNDGNWWQSEFNIFNGTIVYRADGGDQDAVAVNAGQKITLDFNAGTGSIQ